MEDLSERERRAPEKFSQHRRLFQFIQFSPGGLRFTSESEHVFFIKEEGRSHLFILHKHEERRLERGEEKNKKQEGRAV